MAEFLLLSGKIRLEYFGILEGVWKMDAKKGFVSLLIMAMCSLMINVSMAANSSMLWNAEFDGQDDTGTWTKYTTSDAVDSKAFDFDALVEDGQITVGQKALNYGRMGFEFSDAIDVAGSENIYWETKFRYVDKAPSNDEKMFMLNDGGVLIELSSGKLKYGETATGYSINKDVWYTLLVKMDFVNDRYAIYVTGDDKTSYEGDYVSFADEKDLDSINNIKLPRQRTSGLVTNYDYVRIWDEDKNYSVNVTYGEENRTLDSAVGIDTEFDFTLKFTEPVTETSLSDVSIDNGGVIELTALSEDGRYASWHASGLDYETEYTISIPAIGNNPEKTVSFTTAEYIPPEINVVYGVDDKKLDGAVDVSKAATFKVLFELPISIEDAEKILMVPS